MVFSIILAKKIDDENGIPVEESSYLWLILFIKYERKPKDISWTTNYSSRNYVWNKNRNENG